jgi:retinoid hydroxylase
MSEAPAKELPVAFGLPLLGNTLQFLGDPSAFLTDTARRLGPVFEVRILKDRVACFVGPEAFAAFQSDHNVTRQGGSPPHLQELFHPDAVPFLADDAFRRRKGLLMQAFSKDAINGYMPTIERVMRRYGRRWAEMGPLTWAPEIGSMSMSIVRALFIEADPDQDDPDFEKLFDTASKGILAVPINLPFTGYGQALKARDRVREKVAKAVASPSTQEQSLMSRLRAARTETGDKLSDDELRIELFHFFGAYAAVVGGLSFLAMYLGRDPQLRADLRAELSALGKEKLTVQSLGGLELLGRVCKEVRRAQPLVPVSFFGVVKRDFVCRGVRVPQGHKAIGCIAPTLMDPKVFAEPSRFDPDRWRPSRAGEKQESAWVPHGGGAHATAHRCAGEALADIMMKAFAVLMLRDYDWTLPTQSFEPTAGGLFAMPTSGLQAHVVRRSMVDAPRAPAH